MTASSRPRLLVLGATTFRMRAFATWQAMGLHVTLVDGHSTSRYEQLVDEFHPLDVRDTSADLEALARLAERADGITTLADDSQSTVSIVAERAGLPSIGVETAAAARSKSVQRALYDRAGMPSPAWREVRSLDDLDAFFGERDGPAVLKPVDATGGLGALAVDTLAEARRKLGVVLTLSPTRTAIAEDRLSGFEVCLEAAVCGGEVVSAALTDADHLDGPGFVCAYGRFGARRELNPRAERETARLAGTLGLRDGLIHAEYKVDGDDWVILETALRPGGGFCPELTARTTGVNLYDIQARLALGRPVTAANARTEDVSATFAQAQYIPAEGTVRRFVPPAAVLAGLPDVHEIGQQVMPGQKLRSPMSDGGRAGYALGWGEDLAALHEQLQVAADRLCAGMGLRRIVHTAEPAPAVS
jgi:biotin carboxylase